ncbi:superoxide dismutase [Amycolatopsis sp. NPDC059657]|uniref:superoxide dismutase n=1 Tax=Amycolatopsis sp. NPDC059657 TaxID=3346899 RepID=UPI00366D68EE
MRIAPTAISVLIASAFVFSGTSPASAAGSPLVSAHGTFQAYSPDAVAITYKPELVPAGARAHVFALTGNRIGTTTVLAVSGLLSDHEYGAHVHSNACGATGDAAGPHFQHEPDPVKPSVDPAYANPRNEIWLDFTTSKLGTGISSSHVDWGFTDRRPGSIVIHEMHTHTEPGKAGTAGPRLACINVAF